MIKEMNGWKVIQDFYAPAYRYSSIERSASIKYPVNVRVYPKIKDSMLFFFAKKENAEIFRDSCIYRIIVPCIAYDCQRIRYIASDLYIEEFWHTKKLNKKLDHYYLSNAPKGSWVAKSIKCLK